MQKNHYAIMQLRNYANNQNNLIMKLCTNAIMQITQLCNYANNPILQLCIYERHLKVRAYCNCVALLLLSLVTRETIHPNTFCIIAEKTMRRIHI